MAPVPGARGGRGCAFPPHGRFLHRWERGLVLMACQRRRDGKAVGAGRPKARCATPGVAGDRSLSAGPWLSVRGGGRSPATGAGDEGRVRRRVRVARRTGRR